MISRWNDAEAGLFEGDLGQRVYTSRLIGQDPALVLHGGGNTSVKTRRPTAWGDEEHVLYVKGSGRDLATIDEHGFAPVRLSALHGLAGLERLSDLDMARELRAATADPTAPAPSVEAILHALIPHRFVDHTHADAVIAITNTPSGSRHAAEAFGSSVPIVPYVMPGFDLARRCRELVDRDRPETTTGLVLMAHGVFSFGSSARESYERMIDLVSRAERYLQAHGAWELPPPPEPSSLGERRRARLAPVGRRGRRRPAADPPPDGERRRVRVRQSPRPRPGRGAGTGDARPRHPHQAAAAARSRRRRLRRGLPRLLRAVRERRPADARPGAARRARPAARALHGRCQRRRGGSHGRHLRPHDRDDRASRAAQVLAGAPGGRHLRRRVLGPRAGEAVAARAASSLCRRGRASSPGRPPGSAEPARRPCCSGRRRLRPRPRRTGRPALRERRVPRAALRRDRAGRDPPRVRDPRPGLRRARHARALRGRVPGLAAGWRRSTPRRGGGRSRSTWTRT